MSTSLLKRILGLSGSGGEPDSPQTISGSLSSGERVDIGPLRAVNSGGDLRFRHLHSDCMLRWSVSGADAEVSISNLGNRPDEGVIFGPFGNDTWAFVAKVRPERCVVLRPVPHDVPLCRFGPGGDFVHDWEGDALAGTLQTDDQAAGLRAAVAGRAGQ